MSLRIPKVMKTTTWITPQWLIDQIGISDLDPCGFYNEDGEAIVQTARWYYLIDKGMDGLALPWFGSVYCNPPYDKNKEWIEKCYRYHEETGNDVILLVFARVSSIYFQEYVRHATGMVCVPRRLKFLNEKGEAPYSAPSASVLIAFGEYAYERIKGIGLSFRVDHE
jgi:hypothetical protein